MQRRLENKEREEKLLKVFTGISFESRLRTDERKDAVAHPYKVSKKTSSPKPLTNLPY